MGLMLSILAACVGVLEFLEIVSNIIANVAVPNLNYSSEVTSPGLGSTSVLHSEDIEIECPSTILHDTSKTATTKRFLVTEQEDDNVSTRRFVVSDKEQPRNDLIPEFLITQHDTNESRRLLLIDKNEKNRNKSPLPLPKQFIITKTDNQVTQKALKSVKQGVGIEITSLSVKKENTTREKHQSLSFEEVSSFGETLPKALRNPENLSSLVYSNNSSTSTSFGSNSELNDIFDSSTKLKTSQQLEVHDTKEVCNRPSSPYPNLEVAVTKISSGPDLLENPSISLKESDEDLYKSRSASPQKVDIILQSTHFNTTQYWTNKILVEPIRKSTAPCARKIRNKELKRSKSASNLDDQEEDTGVRKTLSTTDLENESKDEQNLNSYETTFLNTLDGVASRKLSRDKSMRRSYKRKSKTTDLDLREKDLKNSRDCSSNGKNSDVSEVVHSLFLLGRLKQDIPEWNFC